MPFLAFIFDLLCLLTPNRQYYTKFSLQVYRGCTGQKNAQAAAPKDGDLRCGIGIPDQKR